MKKIFNSKYSWLIVLLLLVAVNFLASSFHSRFDLTKEKRYTLSDASKKLLRNLDDEVRVEVFLKGNYPAGFKKLVNSVEEYLQECQEYAHGKLKVSYVDPLKGLDDSTASRFIDSIQYFYDIAPYTLQAPAKVGDEMSFKQVLPGAVIYYKDTTVGVNLLKGVRGYGTEPEQLAALYNDVEATLEYKFSSAIQKVTVKEKPLVGYALGNGEGWGFNVNDAVRTIIKNYSFDTVNIHTVPFIPTSFKALVILKPTVPFTDAEKLKIDQYVMHGGKIFWMIDNMYAEFDSLYKSQGFIAYDRALNLEDILFRYGVRINQNLLEDMQCDKLPLLFGNDGQQQQPRLIDWPFFPILNGTNHPISKNLDGVRAMFPNTLDTVKAEGIQKTFLLRSSANARVLEAPAKVDFSFMQALPDIKDFKVKDTAVAVLLEGKFKSLYTGRVSKAMADTLAAYGQPFKNNCDTATKMVVVADGDLATNQVSQSEGPLPMGTNIFTKYTFANKDFYTNTLEYLVNPSGILETRAKDYTLRLLDPVKVSEEKTTWQFLNIILPLLLVIVAGFIYQYIRKRKYTS